MSQFQAGYIFPSIQTLLLENYPQNRVETLLKSLCYFDVEISPSALEKDKKRDSLISVASNMISRGLPTWASLFIEEQFAETFYLSSKKIDEMRTISYPIYLADREFTEYLYRSLHLIDPRFTQYTHFQKSFWESEDSEREFLQLLFDFAPHTVQLLEPQRRMDTLVNFPGDFVQQRVDFALALPYARSKKGMIFEIDDSSHLTQQQQELDGQRKTALQNSDWLIKQIPTTHLSSNHQLQTYLQKTLENLNKSEYIQLIRNNYQNPLYQEPKSLQALQWTLTPFGIARIQKALCHCIQSGILDLNSKKWKIGVIERDVPCGTLAIEDLKKLLTHLFALEGKGRKVPQIDLRIFYTEEFENSTLRDQKNSFLFSKAPRRKKFHLLIDISMLQRRALHSSQPFKTGHTITIRSSYALCSKRIFESNTLIPYAPFVLKENEEGEAVTLYPQKEKALKYFLQNIFRKAEFRPGQLEILNRSLQLKNVLGLLPTGGGKSLAYQLSAILQPGTALVVDPLKSLMEDQKRSFQNFYIDAVASIQSSLEEGTPDKRKKIEEKMVRGEYLFLLISPERLQIPEFREYLNTMKGEAKHGFSYCIIDEVHCVSEWGHDFRTSYLRLGENALKYCIVQREYGGKIPLLGLTATASFDVLTDVQRELGIDDQSVVASSSLERKELHYHVEKVEAQITSPDSFKVRKALGRAKQEALIALIHRIPEKIRAYHQKQDFPLEKNTSMDSFYHLLGRETQAGLIFSPYKGGKTPIGVPSLCQTVIERFPRLKVGTFTGSSKNREKEVESQENQDKFIQNQLNILIATKAFGMGIDKPNVRFTVHINYPSSIESFYQESGRAGRDRRESLCYLLFADHREEKEILQNFHHESFKGIAKEKEILRELLGKITYKDRHRQSSPGIEVLLQSKNNGQSFQLTIGFENDGIHRTLKLLQREVHPQFSEKMIRGALGYCRTGDDFCKNLRKEIRKKTGSAVYPEAEVLDQLKNLFLQIRLKDDTFKAIYRLSTIKIVDDYEIDYNNKTITLVLTKKADAEYEKSLEEYVLRYYSRERGKKVMRGLEKTEEETAFQRWMNFLVDFVYDEIAKKRKQNIDAMEEACRAGLEGRDEEERSENFREFMDLYFHSRYYPELVECSQQGREFDFEWVWEYMELAGDKVDNLKHLRGGSIRLLNETPENPGFLLLKSFSLLLLAPPSKPLFAEGLKCFSEGMILAKEFKELSRRDWEAQLLRFKKKTMSYNGEIAPYLDREISLMQLIFHRKWLKKFNERFLKGYGRTENIR